MKKGILYWDSESLSDNNKDFDIVCNYDDLFDMGDDGTDNLGEQTTNPTNNETMTLKVMIIYKTLTQLRIQKSVWNWCLFQLMIMLASS